MSKTKQALSCGFLAAAAMALSGAAFAQQGDAGIPLWTGMVDKMYSAMDSNRDGMVSRDEFLHEMGKRFDRMDKAKKGMVDKKAIDAILSELAMRPGPGH